MDVTDISYPNAAATAVKHCLQTCHLRPYIYLMQLFVALIDEPQQFKGQMDISQKLKNDIKIRM